MSGSLTLIMNSAEFRERSLVPVDVFIVYVDYLIGARPVPGIVGAWRGAAGVYEMLDTTIM